MSRWRHIATLRSILAAVVLLMVVTTAHAAGDTIVFDAEHPALGYWLGHAQSKNGKVFVALDITREGGATKDGDSPPGAQLTVLELGTINANCDKIELDGKTASVSVPTIAGRATFNGAVSDDGQTMTGTVLMEGPDVKEENKNTEFTLNRSLRAASLVTSKAFTGDLVVPGMGKLNISLVFAQIPSVAEVSSDQDRWVGSADVPAQAIMGLPLIDVEETDGTIKATMPIPMYPATIEAKIDDEHDQLIGRFKQATVDLELKLPRNHSYVSPALRRPQQPKPPYPYESHDLTAPTSGGFSLAGTLTMPKGDGPFPCAVLISGSGQQDRDETLMGHKPFLVIADHLTRNGIAVFRYDDRGVGASGGREQLENATSKDFADDASAVIDMLKTQPGVDVKRIGIIGHSEGGLIAPMVATTRDDVAFIVLLAGPGVNGREILELQGKLILKAEQTDEAEIEEFTSSHKKMLDMVAANASTEEMQTAYREMQKAEAEDDPDNGDEAEAAAEDKMAEAQIAALNSAWMKYFLSYDPRPTLAKVKCPVLAVNGTLDLQVWHEQNLTVIESAIRDAGGDITAKRYENLNHLFQPAKTGGVSEYGAIETTIEPAVLEDVTTWIKRKAGSSN